MDREEIVADVEIEVAEEVAEVPGEAEGVVAAAAAVTELETLKL